jgi:hypothetical protein
VAGKTASCGGTPQSRGRRGQDASLPTGAGRLLQSLGRQAADRAAGVRTPFVKVRMSDVVCWFPCLVRHASVPPETSSTCFIARWPGWRSLKSKSCPVQSDEHLLTVLRYNGQRERVGIAPPTPFPLYPVERNRENRALVRDRPQLFRPMGGETRADRPRGQRKIAPVSFDFVPRRAPAGERQRDEVPDRKWTGRRLGRAKVKP